MLRYLEGHTYTLFLFLRFLGIFYDISFHINLKTWLSRFRTVIEYNWSATAFVGQLGDWHHWVFPLGNNSSQFIKLFHARLQSLVDYFPWTFLFLRYVPSLFILLLLMYAYVASPSHPYNFSPEMRREWSRALCIGLESSFHWPFIPPASPLPQPSGNSGQSLLCKLGHVTSFLATLSGACLPLPLEDKTSPLTGCTQWHRNCHPPSSLTTPLPPWMALSRALWLPATKIPELFPRSQPDVKC